MQDPSTLNRTPRFARALPAFAVTLAASLMPALASAQTLTGSSLSLTSGTPDINLFDNLGSTHQWRMFGSSAKFAIENKTDLPASGDNVFELDDGARPNSIIAADGGKVGLGTAAPGAWLDVRDASGLSWVRLDPGSADEASLELFELNEAADLVLETAGVARWQIKTNAATGRMTFKNLLGTSGPGGGPTTPFKFAPDAVENLLRVGVAGLDVVDINGQLVVSGDCSEQNGPCADYVFEEGYELRSLAEVEAFIEENGHLPNVPSAAAMERDGVNLAHLSGRLLEKVEELTLYTLEQEETIRTLEREHAATLGTLERRLRALEEAGRVGDEG